MADEHIDPFDYIDKSGRYQDYYDVVKKDADGLVFVKRVYSYYVPSSPPFAVNSIGSEVIPLEALTLEALAQVLRLAEPLEAGHRTEGYAFFRWLPEDEENPPSDLSNRQVSIQADYVFPNRFIKSYDIVYKNTDGEISVHRKSEIYLNNPQFPDTLYFPIKVLPSELIPLEALSAESLAKVLEIAGGLKGGNPFRGGEGYADFVWDAAIEEEDRKDMWRKPKHPENRLTILKTDAKQQDQD